MNISFPRSRSAVTAALAAALSTTASAAVLAQSATYSVQGGGRGPSQQSPGNGTRVSFGPVVTPAYPHHGSGQAVTGSGTSTIRLYQPAPIYPTSTPQAASQGNIPGAYLPLAPGYLPLNGGYPFGAPAYYGAGNTTALQPYNNSQTTGSNSGGSGFGYGYYNGEPYAYPLNTLILPGYNYDGYLPYGGNYTFGATTNVYPSVYGAYTGFPGAFYGGYSSVVVVPDNATVIFPSGGEFVPYTGDSSTADALAAGAPYAGGVADARADAARIAGGDASAGDAPAASSLSAPLRSALSDIADAWNLHDMSLMSRHLAAAGKVRIGMSGRYAYSLAASDYKLMTRDAMQRLDTTDFRFVAVRVLPDGEAEARAVHGYQTATGGSGDVYVTYDLRHAPSAAGGGYTISGFTTSTTPFGAGPVKSVPGDGTVADATPTDMGSVDIHN